MLMFLRRTIGVVALGLFLVGCSAGPRLSDTPSAPVDISGGWLMDIDRSDDVEALVSNAFAQAQRELSNQPDDGAPRRSPPTARDRRPPDKMAIVRPDELVFADRHMQISQSQFLVEVTSKRAGYRRYRIGSPISRTGPGGTFEIHSGWNGTDFYAVSESRRGIDIVERYSLSADGTELLRELTLDAPFLDDPVVVRQIYYPE